MIDGVEEPLDIEIDDPRIVPAAPPGAFQRLVRRFARPVAIGV